MSCGFGCAVACLLVFTGDAVASTTLLWQPQGGACPGYEESSKQALCARVVVDRQILVGSQPEVLALMVPGRVEPLQARRIGGDTDTWYGRVVGDEFSHVTFAVRDSSIVGLISTASSRPYRLRRLPDGGTIVEQVVGRTPMADRESGRVTRRAARAVSRCTIETPECNGPAVVDVLPVFTAAAAEWAGGADLLMDWLTVAEWRTNQSFIDSGIKHGVRFKPAKETAWRESGSPINDFDAFREGSSPWIQDIHRWRDEDVHADLVVIVTSGDVSGGHANRPRQPDAGQAFTVVTIQGLTGDDTLTHELGHLLGAGHADGGGAMPFGRAFSEPRPAAGCTPFATIMEGSALCEGCVRLLHWSGGSTARQHCGDRLGDVCADNAAVLNRTACAVAGYR
ncbi:MAG: hypothetical protein IT486_04835 [Gammaproteobacteria bacterium]|nr:hypothetical protein [Gammaproteobacteria bacterium]